jgi:hypothetical protein
MKTLSAVYGRLCLVSLPAGSATDRAAGGPGRATPPAMPSRRTIHLGHFRKHWEAVAIACHGRTDTSPRATRGGLLIARGFPPLQGWGRGAI